MNEHIPAGEVEKLGSYELYGTKLVRWLEHLEVCEECRREMRKPSVKEITDRLNTDEPESELEKLVDDTQTQQDTSTGNFEAQLEKISEVPKTLLKTIICKPYK